MIPKVFEILEERHEIIVKRKESQAWWCRPLIPAIQKAKAGESQVQDQVWQINETLSPQITRALGRKLNGREFDWHTQSCRFSLQYCFSLQKKENLKTVCCHHPIHTIQQLLTQPNWAPPPLPPSLYSPLLSIGITQQKLGQEGFEGKCHTQIVNTSD